MVINGDDRQNLNLDFFKLVNSVVATAIKHPFTQATILMQLGYEPGEIIHKKKYSLPFGILGQNGKMVPYRKGILNGYLQDVGVLKGSIIPTQKITAGMGLAIVDVVSSSLVQTATTEVVKQAIPDLNSGREDECYSDVLRQICREAAIKSAGVIVTRPVHVLVIRQIASLAGDPQMSLIDMIKEGGIFSGLFPSLLYEIGNIFISKSLIYFYRKNKKEIDGLLPFEESSNDVTIEIVSNFSTSLFLYPLKLTATNQAMSGTGMILDSFPQHSWFEIYRELRRNGQLKRGGSCLFRRKIESNPLLPIQTTTTITEMQPAATMIEMATTEEEQKECRE
jgi:hypothetical protein